MTADTTIRIEPQEVEFVRSALIGEGDQIGEALLDVFGRYEKSSSKQQHRDDWRDLLARAEWTAAVLEQVGWEDGADHEPVEVQTHDLDRLRELVRAEMEFHRREIADSPTVVEMIGQGHKGFFYADTQEESLQIAQRGRERHEQAAATLSGLLDRLGVSDPAGVLSQRRLRAFLTREVDVLPEGAPEAARYREMIAALPGEQG